MQPPVGAVRDQAHVGPDEAKDVVDTLAGQQQPARAWAVYDDDLTAGFATRLRQARRQAGDPPYAGIAHATSYSVPTISRAFSGQVLPKWELTVRILKVLGIPAEQIAGGWRASWARAQDQRRPIKAASPAPPAVRQDDATETALPGLGIARTPGPRQEPPAGRLCEDCGALVGDMLLHEAWHWRIERQHRRTVIRAVDSTSG
jgi:hypothetical protein